jgi:hypothetical protein
MANKIIKHYYDEVSYRPVSPPDPPEPDKTKSISELSRKELWDMLSRLRDETEVQRIIRDLKRNSGERDTLDKPFEIDTKTPINQLYHYGIKNQKWGVRRFQNEDGTRTALGKKREREDFDASDDHKNSRSAKAKSPKGLSNDELKKLNERLKLEEEYKRLTKVEKSESWVKEAMQSAGKQALTDFTKGIALGAAKSLVKEISPEFADIAFGIKDTSKSKAVGSLIKPQPKPEPKPKKGS